MGVVDRLVEEAKTRLGVEVVPRGRLEELQEMQYRLEQFEDEASELAYHALDYFAGKPQDLLPEYRNRLAQRSRIALIQDPLAGAEADLLSNFAFGRGIGIPDAEDDEVQKILNEAWMDPVNVEKFTGFEAQRHRSNELITQANLYPAAYIQNGRVRLGFLDADTVTHIVCDPEDEERPLFYVSRKRHVEWDYEHDRVKTSDEMLAPGLPKVVYFPHWQHVEDYLEEEPGAAKPAAEKTGKGLVYHMRINRIGRTQFGTPPWARTLRFYTAMNSLTEAHVAMAQAASTFVAKRVMQGGPETITKAANAILTQTGELGAARFGAGDAPADVRASLGAPPAPGSFWLENQSNKLEAMNLSSGASQAATTAQIVRAPISAASGFGQHYLGDAGNANLATATSLELPTLMTVQAWQETFRQGYKWFADIVIQEAVRAGRLGGRMARVSAQEVKDVLEEHDTLSLAEAEMEAWERLPLATQLVRQKPLTALRLSEAEDREEMERRTGRALGYTLSLPYPGRRNLPDVTALVTGTLPIIDPDGVNIPFRRQLLNFLATHGMNLDDPTGFVDEVMPEEAAAMLMPGLNTDTGLPYEPGEKEARSEKAKIDAGVALPPEREIPPRARGQKDTTRKDPKPRRVREEELGEEAASLFAQDVIEPLLLGSRNGSE
jgi:hypothetical protein